MKISREFKTGFVAVAVIALFIWGYNYLKGLNIFDGPLKTYKTEYSNVQGLNTASVVTINGVDVGKVVDIQFNNNPNKRGWLIVEFSIENDFEFSKKSIAKIYSASLMGGKSLAIIPSYEGETAKPGDFLQGEIESDILSSVTEKLNPLQAKVENVIVRADSLMMGLNDIFNQESRKNLRSSIAQLNQTITNFKDISTSVNELVKNNDAKLSKTLNNTEELTSNLAQISDSLNQSNIGETVKKLEITVNSLNGILSNMESGKGTLGKLLHDEGMYTNLTNASKEMEELLREMKLNPKRFVHFSLFGKKDKGYSPEEQKE
ncbi:MlaD family protein [Lutibacter sp. TH_r2]|uniref:MlaD family protein n=1 Tax=Lutibacter sp. TH_r2 TaxID=3082083 RepID=UPI0029551944|nr:MlaD family protein [Lutibacter sp. TH_r2]MDV7187144.1 MlaD family protein [Lutibacter sp. TH_r2]